MVFRKHKSVFYFSKVYVYVRACSPYEINQQIAFHLATSYWTIKSTNYDKLKLAKSVHLNTQTLNCVQCDTLTLTLKYNTIQLENSSHLLSAFLYIFSSINRNPPKKKMSTTQTKSVCGKKARHKKRNE